MYDIVGFVKALFGGLSCARAHTKALAWRSRGQGRRSLAFILTLDAGSATPPRIEDGKEAQMFFLSFLP